MLYALCNSVQCALSKARGPPWPCFRAQAAATAAAAARNGRKITALFRCFAFRKIAVADTRDDEGDPHRVYTEYKGTLRTAWHPECSTFLDGSPTAKCTLHAHCTRHIAHCTSGALWTLHTAAVCSLHTVHNVQRVVPNVRHRQCAMCKACGVQLLRKGGGGVHGVQCTEHAIQRACAECAVCGVQDTQCAGAECAVRFVPTAPCMLHVLCTQLQAMHFVG